jgi:hypothetical protein
MQAVLQTVEIPKIKTEKPKVEVLTLTNVNVITSRANPD